MKDQRATEFPTDTDFELLAESLHKDIGFIDLISRFFRPWPHLQFAETVIAEADEAWLLQGGATSRLVQRSYIALSWMPKSAKRMRLRPISHRAITILQNSRIWAHDWQGYPRSGAIPSRPRSRNRKTRGRRRRHFRQV